MTNSLKKMFCFLAIIPFTLFANSSPDTLSNAEREGLIKLRQEEKLARDVYIKLGELYSSNVFNNIPKSEQQHMDSMAYLLSTFNIDDPVVSDEIGVFTDPTMQKLYDDFITQGKKSYKDALNVGISIEKLDINDLENYLNQTDKPEIKQVYQQLLNGSKNHLSAFERQLNRID